MLTQSWWHAATRFLPSSQQKTEVLTSFMPLYHHAMLGIHSKPRSRIVLECSRFRGGGDVSAAISSGERYYFLYSVFRAMENVKWKSRQQLSRFRGAFVQLKPANFGKR
mmetsp:Transcript_8572/g.12935  ORF Transcript_8572/g.12935 Transcript_8572/m.12935 type:complete len:109 (-) Transcript_8572:223-549(-)